MRTPNAKPASSYLNLSDLQPSQATAAKVIPLPTRAQARQCNLCKQTYVARSKFARFCDDCKEHNELYHFSEWLPAS